jgi:phage shock protein A
MVVRDQDLVDLAKAVHDSVVDELAGKLSAAVRAAMDELTLRVKQLDNKVQELDRKLIVLEARLNQNLVKQESGELHLW